ncbi:MAG: hypothetical protein ACC608_03100 [Anaerofustis sp.]
MENYTEKMDDRLWEKAEEFDETENYEVVTRFLNNKNEFQSFGEGLTYLINKKYPETGGSDLLKFIKNSCEKNNVAMSEVASNNTLKNWFYTDIRPKKSDASRNSMFALAFALMLNEKETIDLFHKVFLDRAFNNRSAEEIIFYYCIKHKKSWKDAKQMTQLIDDKSNTDLDKTIYSKDIRNDIDSISDEAELLSYINNHSNNFRKNNVHAECEKNKLLLEVKELAIQEIALPEHESQFDGRQKGDKSLSNNLLYEILTEIKVSANTGTRTVFQNARLPKEIKNRFPESNSFCKNNLTSEELRKVIILLFSYKTWYMVQWEGANYGIEDYTVELNQLLIECNYPLLYSGNPFDWLFLFCTQDSRPLDAFRGIIQEVLEE